MSNSNKNRTSSKNEEKEVDVVKDTVEKKDSSSGNTGDIAKRFMELYNKNISIGIIVPKLQSLYPNDSISVLTIDNELTLDVNATKTKIEHRKN